ncbi:MAG: hypothetical protein AB9834_06350 [Lentimicrobium sp.]
MRKAIKAADKPQVQWPGRLKRTPGNRGLFFRRSTWNGCDQQGNPVLAGMYTFRITLNGKSLSGSFMKVE